MGAGIKDVARLAGVSVSTVSYALSGKRPISNETRIRVEEAAEELGYRPRSKKQQVDPKYAAARTKVLVVSAPLRDYTNVPNYAVFFFALATAASAYGYKILLLMDVDGGREMARIAHEGLVDGIFLLDVTIQDPRAAIAATLPIPVVSIGIPVNREAVYSVDSDFEGMARNMLDKAYALGHRHILLTGSVEPAFVDGSNFIVRIAESIRDYCEELGIELTVGFTARDTMADIRLMLDEAFATDPEISLAIVESSASTASPLTMGLAERGLRVPEDVSLMVCAAAGNPSMAGRLRPDEMPMNPNATCRRAVEVMVEVLSGKPYPKGSVEFTPVEYRAHGTLVPYKK